MNGTVIYGMTVFCGLNCLACPIYIAAREKDPGRREKLKGEIATRIFEHYGKRASPDEITDCDGCRSSTERLFSGCADCQVRKCALDRGVEICAVCPAYVCDKVREFMSSEKKDR